MGDNEVVDLNSTTQASTEGSTEKQLAQGIQEIISTVITVCFLLVAVAVVYTVYRLACRSRSRNDGKDGNSGRGKEFFDQFDVNCSQLNLETEERKFTNPAAKISSESDSISSNLSTSTPTSNGASGTPVRSAHGDTRFSVNRVRDRSSRPSSLKLKVPRSFGTSTNSPQDEQFALALIDKKSNTVHNIDLSDCVIIDRQSTVMDLTPTSAIFAHRWRDQTRRKRARRGSVEVGGSAANGRTRLLPRQTSCPHTLSAKAFASESLSSHSDDSNEHTTILEHETNMSDVDVTTHKVYDGPIFAN